MLINTNEIKELLEDESITGYRIGKETNVRQQTFSDYRTGKQRFENMPVKTLVELQSFINKRKEERKMKIKFIGRNTQNMKVAEVTVRGTEPFLQLYNELVDSEVISRVDYDPYQREQANKANLDYDEIMEEFEENEELLNNLPDLTEEEIYYLILDEDGNAYRQEFYVYINDEEFKVDNFDFERKQIEVDLEDYETKVVSFDEVDAN